MANGTLPAGTFPSEYGQTTDSDGAGNLTTTVHAVDSDFTTNSLTTSVTSGYNDTLDSASTGGLLLRSTLRPSDSDFNANASSLLYTYSLDSDKNYKTLTDFEKTALVTMISTRSPITGFAQNVGDMKLGDQSVEFKITI